MSNELIFSLEIFVVFSLVVLLNKFFSKSGLLAWVSVATVISNIAILKNAHIAGVNVTLGSVIFSSIFLATDILTECYGVKEAKRAVLMSFFCSIAFLICTQITLLYKASEIDFADEALKQILSINLRVTCSSLLMFFIANMADVLLYEKLRIKTHGRYIWIRNNLATITCNCLENFFFVFLAFLGIFDIAQCLEIALSITFIEVITSLCDTPFLYLAVRSRNENRD